MVGGCWLNVCVDKKNAIANKSQIGGRLGAKIVKYTTDLGSSETHSKVGGGEMQPKITTFAKHNVPKVVKSQVNALAKWCE